MHPDRLAWFAVAVWAAWLGLIALLGSMLVCLVWHPHFGLVTGWLVVLVGTWLSLIFVAGWRVSLGPARARALGWLLIGSAPVWFLASHIFFGLRAGHERNQQVEYNLALKLLFPLAESVMDFEARFRYPVRTVGSKVVMISPPIDRAAARVAAMDRHVEGIETRLGRGMVGRVHWARGPLFGMESKAIFGLCMGSRPGTAKEDAEGLAEVDRHEVAHCVASSFCPFTAEPAALLSEGWAEANMGHDPTDLDARLWDWREQGRSGTLTVMLGPKWYGRHEWPVYIHGAPLVNYLLRQYGPDRFLQLYTTSRPGSIDADCRRVLGVGLDQLDREFWSDMEQRVGPEPARVGRLKRLAVGPGVAPEAWRSFLNAYLADADRLVAPYGQSRIVAEQTHGGNDAKGQPFTLKTRLDIVQSGNLRGFRRTTTNQVDHGFVAHPLLSFDARRDKRGNPWRVRVALAGEADRFYRRTLAEFEQSNSIHLFAPYLLLISEEWAYWTDHASFRLVGLDRFVETGKEFVRVVLEDAGAEARQSWRTLTVVLSVADHHAAQSEEAVFPDGSKSVGRFEYEGERDGAPLLRRFVTVRRMPNGEQRSYQLGVEDRQFGPTPEAELTEARWLDGPREPRLDDPPPPASGFGLNLANAYLWCLTLGVVSLASGFPLVVLGRSRGAIAAQALGG